MKMVVIGIKYTCFYAAYNGHLDCLRYAIYKDCPGSENYKRYLKKTD